jgi:hypothetical protein
LDRNFLLVYDREKACLIGPDAQIVLDTSYTAIENMDISYDYLKVTKNGKTGLFNLATKTFLIEHIYEDIQHFEDNYFLVEQDGKRGLFDIAEIKIILDPVYDGFELWENFIIIQSNGKNGIATSNGTVILEPKFAHIWTEGSKLIGTMLEDGDPEIYYNLNGEITEP